ncbi:MAG: ABC transporter ATP-binding protein [Armatimonadetes bacterium]|nr:ABC transporter ATP-binding protein [Armatimonadota bacterium]
MLKTISGILKSKEGEIYYQNNLLNNIPAHLIVKAGIAHVPEGRKIFANLSVLENLELGAYLQKNKKEIKKNFDKIFSLFPRLKERKNQSAGTLSGGEQQMLAIGRGLMAQPKLLLLDEPSMGLSPIFVREIFDIIKEINQFGATILLVEQNAHMALSIAHRAYILETGKIVLKGGACDLAKMEEVKNAYLGIS